MNYDTLIVLIIVALAAFFVIRRLVRQARSSDVSCGCGGGCGDSSGCSGCSSAPGGLSNYDASRDAGCACRDKDEK